MIPATALDLENQRAQNLDRIRQRRSLLSSERVEKENRGNHMLFLLSLLYLTLFFNRESN